MASASQGLTAAQTFFDEKCKPQFADVPYVTAADLLVEVRSQATPDLLLVDVRSTEEQSVSMLDGAITAKELFQTPERAAGKHVVCYCCIGGRSGKFIKEIMDQKRFGDDKGGSPWKTIRNLELSLIGWCNHGGTLVDSTGQATTKVHAWSSKFAEMYGPGYEVLIEPMPLPTEWHRTIVLVGGGHAHAQVIKGYNSAVRPPWTKVILIDPLKSASYSGMVPGCVAEQYTQDQTKIHLEPLARWGNITYLNASVVDIDPQLKRLTLGPSPYTSECGSLPEGCPTVLSYDVVSFDVGCRTAHTSVPGVEDFAIPTRPIHLLVSRIDEKLASFSGSTLKLVVCGGGAAGIELALTTMAKIKKKGKDVVCSLICSSDELLRTDPIMVRRAMAKVLSDRNITVLRSCRVERITEAEIILDNGSKVPHDLAIWPTGAASHKVAASLSEAGVATSAEGWIRVHNSLQSISFPSIFAAGDCCTFEHLDVQPGKAGVYAVRTGPILISNLLGYLNSKELQEYKPQPEFLRLFNCGDGYGLGIRHGVAMYGSWVWEWKDFIDQGFMNLFKEENLPPLSSLKGADTRQFDAATQSSVSSAPDDATEAASVLTSKDAALPMVKDIINRMNGDADYRKQVVQICYDKDAAEAGATSQL